ncbi:MAG: helix-turn-helix domain-containing protein [Tepidibacter sp.]|jgi:transcriptional regulator with XRE-family HTH domain|uniref:helix-turn-helix domain-containing protein n=1 Tax=Tepidibacter sp. TaxID=2529387 RepID=UPI0025D83951|nr:helix-turn-helix transcriptional regulator [Tepidibacter sp.]MCT4507555.1 helix-turn-helix domain-containing protein [Tepidibacter sp.]
MSKMSELKGFGARLKDAIKKSNYTQKEISEIIQINQDTVTNYIKEKSYPKIDILLKLSNITNVSTDWLLTGKGKGPNEIKSDTATNNSESLFNKNKNILEKILNFFNKDNKIDIDKIGEIDIEKDMPELFKEIKIIESINFEDLENYSLIIEDLKSLPKSELQEVRNFIDFKLLNSKGIKKGQSSTSKDINNGQVLNRMA